MFFELFQFDMNLIDGKVMFWAAFVIHMTCKSCVFEKVSITWLFDAYFVMLRREICYPHDFENFISHVLNRFCYSHDLQSCVFEKTSIAWLLIHVQIKKWVYTWLSAQGFWTKLFVRHIFYTLRLVCLKYIEK